MHKRRQRGAAIVLLLTAIFAGRGLFAAATKPAAEAKRAATAAASKPASKRASKKDAPPRPLDINVANIKELEELPGVGPTTAQSIINFRQKSGRFHRIEDLLVIRGISRRKFELMRPYLTVGTPPAAPKPAPAKPATPVRSGAPPAKPSTAPAAAKPAAAAPPAKPVGAPAPASMSRARAGASSTTPAKPSSQEPAKRPTAPAAKPSAPVQNPPPQPSSQ